jgi:hypothetical protein
VTPRAANILIFRKTPQAGASQVPLSLRGHVTVVTAQSDRTAAALVACYRIERHLGEAGMATVYLAEDLRYDRKVALELPTTMGGEFADQVALLLRVNC